MAKKKIKNSGNISFLIPVASTVQQKHHFEIYTYFRSTNAQLAWVFCEYSIQTKHAHMKTQTGILRINTGLPPLVSPRLWMSKWNSLHLHTLILLWNIVTLAYCTYFPTIYLKNSGKSRNIWPGWPAAGLKFENGTSQIKQSISANHSATTFINLQ